MKPLATATLELGFEPVGRDFATRPCTSAPRLIGESDSMRDLQARILAAARTQATVLITGETGTGKGVVARAIHSRSARSAEPFTHMDCAGLAAGTVESELFGHERGAFTGAFERRRGRLETAGTGSLFLDEIGELDPHLQIKFLRVLQERTFERVGGNQTYSLRARIIAATHRELHSAVCRGGFRSDLFYRLNVLRIHVPPLRERTDDLPMLARHGCERVSRELGRVAPRLSPSFLSALAEHAWPGNVRELMNVLERCLASHERPELTRVELIEAIEDAAPFLPNGETPLMYSPQIERADRAHDGPEASD